MGLRKKIMRVNTLFEDEMIFKSPYVRMCEYGHVVIRHETSGKVPEAIQARKGRLATAFPRMAYKPCSSAKSAATRSAAYASYVMPFLAAICAQIGFWAGALAARMFHDSAPDS